MPSRRERDDIAALSEARVLQLIDQRFRTLFRRAATGGAPGGGADHGSLTGLADDDHTQYLQDTAGTGGDGITVASRVISIDLDTDSGLEFDSGELRLANGRVLNRTATTVTVVNTTTETDLYRFTVPAGTLAADGDCLRFTAWGSYTNNGAAANTIRPSFDFGSTTLWFDASANLGISSAERGWYIDCMLMRDAEDSQRLGGELTLADEGPATNGYGSFNNRTYGTAFGGTAAEDDASALDFALRVQHQLADANTTISLFGAILQKL
jgi:hypothetical protein